MNRRSEAFLVGVLLLLATVLMGYLAFEVDGIAAFVAFILLVLSCSYFERAFKNDW